MFVTLVTHLGMVKKKNLECSVIHKVGSKQDFEGNVLFSYSCVIDTNRCNLNILMSDQLCLQWWLDYILTVS